MDEQATTLFRIICITAIALGFATYPWLKAIAMNLTDDGKNDLLY